MPVLTAQREAEQYAAQQRLAEVTEQAEALRDTVLNTYRRLSELEDNYDYLFGVAMGLIEDERMDGRRRPVRPWPPELREAIRLLARGCDRWTR